MTITITPRAPPINKDGTLTDITTPDQRKPGRNGNEEVHHKPQRSKTVASSSGGLVTYPLEGLYSTAPADWSFYIEKHERGLIITIRNDTDNTTDYRMTATRKQKWD